MTYSISYNDPLFHHHDASGTLAHDFQYSYYAGTNRLRETGPFLEDIIYDGGRVLSNSKVYRSITVQGNSYVPAGKQVVLRATEKITLSPQFRAASGRRFRARLVRDEDMYQYDAIGNLVQDQAEGTKITWTPYGKVRTVSAQSDTVVTTFRYDGAGNRIEKRVVTNDTIVAVTRYLRDASGNVMAIYKDSTLQEQPIYGSARLGQYQRGARPACLTLGTRRYELSNHLGNVLTVITDNIGMSADTTWARVVSASDYYPFGLTMEGRNYQDSLYRYGFNGKEKDDQGEWGSTNYDYGFRIYNPSIAKFLSVDPLTKRYPMLTPYQFASNRPIDGIDLDGLEYYTYVFNIYDNTGAVQVRKIDHTQINKRNLKKWSKSFGPGGRGVQYVYNYYENGQFVRQERNDNTWEVRQRRTGFVDFLLRKTRQNLERHGLYYGSGSITTAGPAFDSPYNFAEDPIDMVDAIAREHDIEQDIEDYESTDGWQDPQFAPADIRFVRRLKQYLKNIKDPAYIDPFTGRKPSREAKRAARNAIILFSLEIKRKLGQKFQESLEQLENGVDSQTVNDEFNKFRDEVDKAKTQDISLPSN